MDVTFVTSNARKLAEARAILGATPALTLTSRALDLPELQGEPEDVARAKARRAAVVVNGPALVEDTSLCYVALKGLPGPYVKWFLDKLGHEAGRALVPVRRRSRRDDRRSSRTLHPGALSVALCRPMKPPRHQTKSKY